jgi:hypothetical protein
LASARRTCSLLSMWQYRSLLIEFLHHRYAPMIVIPQRVRLSAAGANPGNHRER